MQFTTISLLALSGIPSILASPLLAERAVVSTSTSCTATVPQPTPQPLICGQEGRLRAEKGYLSTSPDNMFFSAEQCYQSCRTMTSNNKGCLTFAYNAKNGSCMYYSRTIKSQDFVVDLSTNNVFYNNRCWKNKCTVIKSTIGAAPTTAKSTKTKTTKVKTTKTKSTKTKATKTKATKTASSKPTATTSDKTIAPIATSTSTTSSTSKSTSTKTQPTTTPSSCPTTTDLSIAACPTTRVNLLSGLNVLNFQNYFSGTQLTENPNNPGALLNGVLARNVVELPSTLAACDAVAQCAAQANILGLANAPMSFDLHLVGDANGDGGCKNWECVLYPGANTDQSQFNVRNDSVKAVFGYSGTLLGLGLPIGK